MVFFNYSTLQVAAKVVYYGPALAGKTTNLQWIFEHSRADSRGEMVSLATETDRTLFFDLLPLDVGTVAGFKTRIQLYTVPGQVFYNTTRKLVLKGVDGVVFVADSQRTMFQANVDSLRNLEENLREMGIALDGIPLVFQYNKRDLPNVSSIEELNGALNRGRRPCIEATAIAGDGVFESLTLISKETLVALEGRLKQRHQPAGDVASLPTGRPRPASMDPASVLGMTAARTAASEEPPEPAAEAPRGREASVVLIAHPRHENLGARYRLPMHICIEVGRSSEVDISLPGVASISRRHARLNHRGDVVQIEDLSSEGGTFVNDRRINGHHFLKSGDVFQVGAAHFKFLHDDDPEQAYQRTIYQLYMRDGLTGIFNRGKFFEELEREVFHAGRHRRPLSLVLFDVDQFRKVGERHGRLCGDHVLQQLVRLTAQYLLADQAFARVGDDELAILSPETGAAAAMGLAEQIRVRVAEEDFRYGDAVVQLTCTFGVAALEGEVQTADDLYAAAARELARAKNRRLALRALVGQNLGRYCIESSLGRGGMAEVYQARDTKLKRDVAIKVILPELASESGFQQRFEQEARRAAALDHPHIVPIYDIGEQAGLAFLVMPWIQGGTLAEKLVGRRHPLPQAVALLEQLASALDEAHAMEVLHHDVKPQNVLVGKGGRLLLADFGLAKLRLPGDAAASSPIYMAPELAAGEEAMAASDLYSLAVIAYELLAGKPPFTAAGHLDVLHQHADSPVPLLAPDHEELPPEVDHVFARALAKEPGERPSSCRAFVRSLADCAVARRREDTVELDVSELSG